MSDGPGSDIIVKDKTTTTQKFSCVFESLAEDFILSDQNILDIKGDYLITDQGTSPLPRGLDIYNLRTKTSVFDSTYNRPLDVTNKSITFWQPTNEVATALNCPEFEYNQQNGSGSIIESHVIVDFDSLTVKELGEKRCSFSN